MMLSGVFQFIRGGLGLVVCIGFTLRHAGQARAWIITRLPPEIGQDNWLPFIAGCVIAFTLAVLAYRLALYLLIDREPVSRVFVHKSEGGYHCLGFAYTPFLIKVLDVAGPLALNIPLLIGLYEDAPVWWVVGSGAALILRLILRRPFALTVTKDTVSFLKITRRVGLKRIDIPFRHAELVAKEYKAVIGTRGLSHTEDEWQNRSLGIIVTETRTIPHKLIDVFGESAIEVYGKMAATFEAVHGTPHVRV